MAKVIYKFWGGIGVMFATSQAHAGTPTGPYDFNAIFNPEVSGSIDNFSINGDASGILLTAMLCGLLLLMACLNIFNSELSKARKEIALLEKRIRAAENSITNKKGIEHCITLLDDVAALKLSIRENDHKIQCLKRRL